MDLCLQAPVTVNIVLKDQTCLPYMADVGMHILYYCKHCTMYSQHLLHVIEHLKSCPVKGTDGKCGDPLQPQHCQAAARLKAERPK